MNYGPLIFLAAFFALASSWFGLVLTPQMQVGQLQQTNTLITANTYPLGRSGMAREGLQVYRANGCAYCHSQQIRQAGTVCDVVVTTANTNPATSVAVLLKLKPGMTEAEAGQFLGQLPKPLAQGLTRSEADAMIRTLGSSATKAELWIRPVGPDIDRGWGKRRSVAEDYLFDSPVMLGTRLIGPDISNLALRQPDPAYHFRHLYDPKGTVTGSTMPPYRFLFEKRKIERAASPDALALPPELAPPSGYEIVPKYEAKALVAYLTSLRTDAPLFESPLTVAPPPPEPSTNAPSGNTPVK